MKQTLWLLLALGLVVTVVLWWQTPEVKPITMPAVALSTATEQTQPKQEVVTATATLRVTEHIETAMKQQFAVVASVYAAELKHPAYSRPLTAEDAQLLNPNQYVVQHVPMQGGASAAIVLSQYRFIYPEPITITLMLSGLTASQAEFSMRDEQTGERVAQSAMVASDDGYSLTLAARKDWHGAMRVEITFRADGQQQLLHTGIEYQQPTAKITGLANAYADGPDIVIPVRLDVSQAGTYRLRANLFSEQGQPLAHLIASSRLALGEQQLELRAYKTVLAGVEGPYILNTLMLELRSAAPGEVSRYGNSDQSEYRIDFKGLTQLSDEAWQQEESEILRLQFLQQLAGD